ncbi:MAG TPA: YhjD/YihY/BrkB family envelope integrity protein [Holophaga sp.]|nr:YhjD/YihY/BrkB family envelope integrity protein [Holophaga sp.]
MLRLPPVPLPLKRTLSRLKEAGRGWLRHRAQSRGAALAFYGLFSLSPLLVLVLALAGRILGPLAARGEVFAQLKGLLGPVGARAVESGVLEAHGPGAGSVAAPVAFLLLVLGATSVFAELKDSLDEIWECRGEGSGGIRGILRGRLLALAVVGVLALLLLASVALSWGLALLAPGLPRAVPFLARAFSLGVMGALFTVLYRLLPDGGPGWGDALRGALLTLALSAAGSRLLGAYLAHSAVQTTFGAAGSLAALLLWAYWSAQIFLLGAEFSRQAALDRPRARP